MKSGMDDRLKECLLTALRRGFDECGIPQHCRGGLELYLTEGIEPGGFLMAVLCNNLTEAVGMADHINASHLKSYVWLMHNFMPSDSHGSPENVKEWLKQFAIEAEK